ncbi:MAG: hypothetical protein WBE92_14070 [Steroidobacteraceae bacterium]
MADLEGFEGVLGNETPEAESSSSVAGADAVALSLAMQKVADDPALSRAASDYLAEQRHLVQIQIKHFDEERRLGIAAAKRRRYADHMRNALYTCIAVLVLGVLVGATRMTLDAIHDGSLVIEGFTVPPDLVAQGASGEALANDFVTRLAAIGSLANHSFTQSRQVRAAEANAPKVQIPETGISLDELERFLHRWLGHQTVLAGQVLDEPDGRVAISLDIQGSAPIEVQGSRAALEQLMQQAAEQVFAVLDPVNYSNYLSMQAHNDEALQVAQRYAQNPDLAALPPFERANAYSLLGDKDPDRHRALAEALVAIDQDPRVAFGWYEAASGSSDLGHDQAMVDFSRRVFATKLADQAPAERAAYPAVISLSHISIDRATGDYAAAERDWTEFYLSAPAETGLSDRYANSAEMAALMHDEARSREDLVRALITGSLGTTVLTARWYVSSSAGDWSQALADAKALIANGGAQASAAFNSSSEAILETQYRPWLALAEAMTGDTASAAALISQTATDCYLCVRTRARVAAAAGDAATADRWFAEAVHQAPDLPLAYYEWGQVLLARGDLAGAARELSLAHDKGPHFADPLKTWGDVLVKQGQFKQALGKYDEALKYAPNWMALKQAREAAAADKRT